MLPCKYTWRVGVGWVPDPANGKACPAEEQCTPPSNPGTFDGQIDYGPCLAESPGPVQGQAKRKPGKGRSGR